MGKQTQRKDLPEASQPASSGRTTAVWRADLGVYCVTLCPRHSERLGKGGEKNQWAPEGDANSACTARYFCLTVKSIAY